MNHPAETPAYGLWTLVFINSAVFILFAFSYFKPKTRRDWRTFGSFSGFILALFVEMYGFPLTIFLLSGWLAQKFPGVDLWSHDAGHLWYRLLGLQGNPHSSPIHILSNVLIVAGFFLLAGAWRVLFRAQQSRGLAVKGPYRYVRHPQYVAFIVIMFGFLLQWPTLVTLLMFPVLVLTYVRLAHREEREVSAEFGEAWNAYADRTPRWLPRLNGRGAGPTLARGTP
jgi:protein-S-isoprenylcysteine O-methyltransferase Ste14